MSRTVKSHFEDCKQVEKVIDNANALLTKCSSELKVARDVLEGLKKYQHPELRMRRPYSMNLGTDKDVNPASVIDSEIKRINELLGDRA